jgi:hypothetical protein
LDVKIPIYWDEFESGRGELERDAQIWSDELEAKAKEAARVRRIDRCRELIAFGLPQRRKFLQSLSDNLVTLTYTKPDGKHEVYLSGKQLVKNKELSLYFLNIYYTIHSDSTFNTRLQPSRMFQYEKSALNRREEVHDNFDEESDDYSLVTQELRHLFLVIRNLNTANFWIGQLFEGIERNCTLRMNRADKKELLAFMKKTEKNRLMDMSE